MYDYSDDLISDFFKDTNGFRPGSGYMAAWDAMTPDQKQEEWDYLAKNFERNQAREQAEQAEVISNFEKKILDLLELGAGNRETAIRWFLDSLELSESDAQYGAGYVCYKLGFPYSMESVFEPFLGKER